MDKFKKGIDIYGWVGCLIIVGVLWLTCMWEALHDYFIPNAIELSKFIVALFGTVIIWALYLLSGSRDWLEAQRTAIDWGADKAVEIVERVDKIGVKSFKEIHNIGVETNSQPFRGDEVIGED